MSDESREKYPHVFLVRLDDERLRRLEAIRSFAGVNAGMTYWRGAAVRFAIDCCYDLFVSGGTNDRQIPPFDQG